MAIWDDSVELAEKPKASFLRRALTMLPVAQNQYFLHPSLKQAEKLCSSIKGKVKTLSNLFDSPKSPAEKISKSLQLPSPGIVRSLEFRSSFSSISTFRLPGTEDRIVVYSTSLRGIRRTYEDCHAVRMIFRGFNVWIDERDISMDSEYKKELQRVLGEKRLRLPQIFIKGKYIGDADVIRNLFECGELSMLIEGIPIRKAGIVCESCGDMRFVPCLKCSGSRKVFDEEEEVLKRCLGCNENGLIRCPRCCL